MNLRTTKIGLWARLQRIRWRLRRIGQWQLKCPVCEGQFRSWDFFPHMVEQHPDHPLTPEIRERGLAEAASAMRDGVAALRNHDSDAAEDAVRRLEAANRKYRRR